VTQLRLALVLTAVLASAAHARDDGTAVLQRACSADYTRLCDGLDPRGTEIVACFQKNIREVSPGCRAAIANHAETGSGPSGRSQ